MPKVVVHGIPLHVDRAKLRQLHENLQILTSESIGFGLKSGQVGIFFPLDYLEPHMWANARFRPKVIAATVSCTPKLDLGLEAANSLAHTLGTKILSYFGDMYVEVEVQGYQTGYWTSKT